MSNNRTTEQYKCDAQFKTTMQTVKHFLSVSFRFFENKQFADVVDSSNPKKENIASMLRENADKYDVEYSFFENIEMQHVLVLYLGACRYISRHYLDRYFECLVDLDSSDSIKFSDFLTMVDLFCFISDVVLCMFKQNLEIVRDGAIRPSVSDYESKKQDKIIRALFDEFTPFKPGGFDFKHWTFLSPAAPIIGIDNPSNSPYYEDSKMKYAVDVLYETDAAADSARSDLKISPLTYDLEMVKLNALVDYGRFPFENKIMDEESKDELCVFNLLSTSAIKIKMVQGIFKTLFDWAKREKKYYLPEFQDAAFVRLRVVDELSRRDVVIHLFDNIRRTQDAIIKRTAAESMMFSETVKCKFDFYNDVSHNGTAAPNEHCDVSKTYGLTNRYLNFVGLYEQTFQNNNGLRPIDKSFVQNVKNISIASEKLDAAMFENSKEIHEIKTQNKRSQAISHPLKTTHAIGVSLMNLDTSKRVRQNLVNRNATIDVGNDEDDIYPVYMDKNKMDALGFDFDYGYYKIENANEEATFSRKFQAVVASFYDDFLIQADCDMQFMTLRWDKCFEDRTFVFCHESKTFSAVRLENVLLSDVAKKYCDAIIDFLDANEPSKSKRIDREFLKNEMYEQIKRTSSVKEQIDVVREGSIQKIIVTTHVEYIHVPSEAIFHSCKTHVLGEIEHLHMDFSHKLKYKYVSDRFEDVVTGSNDTLSFTSHFSNHRFGVSENHLSMLSDVCNDGAISKYEQEISIPTVSNDVENCLTNYVPNKISNVVLRLYEGNDVITVRGDPVFVSVFDTSGIEDAFFSNSKILKDFALSYALSRMTYNYESSKLLERFDRALTAPENISSVSMPVNISKFLLNFGQKGNYDAIYRTVNDDGEDNRNYAFALSRKNCNYVSNVFLGIYSQTPTTYIAEAYNEMVHAIVNEIVRRSVEAFSTYVQLFNQGFYSQDQHITNNPNAIYGFLNNFSPITLITSNALHDIFGTVILNDPNNESAFFKLCVFVIDMIQSAITMHQKVTANRSEPRSATFLSLFTLLVYEVRDYDDNLKSTLLHSLNLPHMTIFTTTTIASVFYVVFRCVFYRTFGTVGNILESSFDPDAASNIARMRDILSKDTFSREVGASCEKYLYAASVFYKLHKKPALKLHLEKLGIIETSKIQTVLTYGADDVMRATMSSFFAEKRNNRMYNEMSALKSNANQREDSHIPPTIKKYVSRLLFVESQWATMKKIPPLFKNRIYDSTLKNSGDSRAKDSNSFESRFAIVSELKYENKNNNPAPIYLSFDGNLVNVQLPEIAVVNYETDVNAVNTLKSLMVFYANQTKSKLFETVKNDVVPWFDFFHEFMKKGTMSLSEPDNLSSSFLHDKKTIFDLASCSTFELLHRIKNSKTADRFPIVYDALTYSSTFGKIVLFENMVSKTSGSELAPNPKMSIIFDTAMETTFLQYAHDTPIAVENGSTLYRQHTLSDVFDMFSLFKTKSKSLTHTGQFDITHLDLSLNTENNQDMILSVFSAMDSEYMIRKSYENKMMHMVEKADYDLSKTTVAYGAEMSPEAIGRFRVSILERLVTSPCVFDVNNIFRDVRVDLRVSDLLSFGVNEFYVDIRKGREIFGEDSTIIGTIVSRNCHRYVRNLFTKLNHMMSASTHFKTPQNTMSNLHFQYSVPLNTHTLEDALRFNDNRSRAISKDQINKLKNVNDLIFSPYYHAPSVGGKNTTPNTSTHDCRETSTSSEYADATDRYNIVGFDKKEILFRYQELFDGKIDKSSDLFRLPVEIFANYMDKFRSNIYDKRHEFLNTENPQISNGERVDMLNYLKNLKNIIQPVLKSFDDADITETIFKPIDVLKSSGLICDLIYELLSEEKNVDMDVEYDDETNYALSEKLKTFLDRFKNMLSSYLDISVVCILLIDSIKPTSLEELYTSISKREFLRKSKSSTSKTNNFEKAKKKINAGFKIKYFDTLITNILKKDKIEYSLNMDPACYASIQYAYYHATKENSQLDVAIGEHIEKASAHLQNMTNKQILDMILFSISNVDVHRMYYDEWLVGYANNVNVFSRITVHSGLNRNPWVTTEAKASKYIHHNHQINTVLQNNIVVCDDVMGRMLWTNVPMAFMIYIRKKVYFECGYLNYDAHNSITAFELLYGSSIGKAAPPPKGKKTNITSEISIKFIPTKNFSCETVDELHALQNYYYSLSVEKGRFQYYSSDQLAVKTTVDIDYFTFKKNANATFAEIMNRYYEKDTNFDESTTARACRTDIGSNLFYEKHIKQYLYDNDDQILSRFLNKDVVGYGMFDPVAHTINMPVVKFPEEKESARPRPPKYQFPNIIEIENNVVNLVNKSAIAEYIASRDVCNTLSMIYDSKNINAINKTHINEHPFMCETRSYDHNKLKPAKMVIGLLNDIPDHPLIKEMIRVYGFGLYNASSSMSRIDMLELLIATIKREIAYLYRKLSHLLRENIARSTLNQQHNVIVGEITYNIRKYTTRLAFYEKIYLRSSIYSEECIPVRQILDADGNVDRVVVYHKRQEHVKNCKMVRASGRNTFSELPKDARVYDFVNFSADSSALSRNIPLDSKIYIQDVFEFSEKDSNASNVVEETMRDAYNWRSKNNVSNIVYVHDANSPPQKINALQSIAGNQKLKDKLLEFYVNKTFFGFRSKKKTIEARTTPYDEVMSRVFGIDDIDEPSNAGRLVENWNHFFGLISNKLTTTKPTSSKWPKIYRRAIELSESVDVEENNIKKKYLTVIAPMLSFAFEKKNIHVSNSNIFDVDFESGDSDNTNMKNRLEKISRAIDLVLFFCEINKIQLVKPPELSDKQKEYAHKALSACNSSEEDMRNTIRTIRTTFGIHDEDPLLSEYASDETFLEEALACFEKYDVAARYKNSSIFLAIEKSIAKIASFENDARPVFVYTPRVDAYNATKASRFIVKHNLTKSIRYGAKTYSESQTAPFSLKRARKVRSDTGHSKFEFSKSKQTVELNAQHFIFSEFLKLTKSKISPTTMLISSNATTLRNVSSNKKAVDLYNESIFGTDCKYAIIINDDSNEETEPDVRDVRDVIFLNYSAPESTEQKTKTVKMRAKSIVFFPENNFLDLALSMRFEPLPKYTNPFDRFAVLFRSNPKTAFERDNVYEQPPSDNNNNEYSYYKKTRSKVICRLTVGIVEYVADAKKSRRDSKRISHNAATGQLKCDFYSDQLSLNTPATLTDNLISLIYLGYKLDVLHSKLSDYAGKSILKNRVNELPEKIKISDDVLDEMVVVFMNGYDAFRTIVTALVRRAIRLYNASSLSNAYDPLFWIPTLMGKSETLNSAFVTGISPFSIWMIVFMLSDTAKTAFVLNFLLNLELPQFQAGVHVPEATTTLTHDEFSNLFFDFADNSKNNKKLIDRAVYRAILELNAKWSELQGISKNQKNFKNNFKKHCRTSFHHLQYQIIVGKSIIEEFDNSGVTVPDLFGIDCKSVKESILEGRKQTPEKDRALKRTYDEYLKTATTMASSLRDDADVVPLSKENKKTVIVEYGVSIFRGRDNVPSIELISDRNLNDTVNANTDPYKPVVFVHRRTGDGIKLKLNVPKTIRSNYLDEIEPSTNGKQNFEKIPVTLFTLLAEKTIYFSKRKLSDLNVLRSKKIETTKFQSMITIDRKIVRRLRRNTILDSISPTFSNMRSSVSDISGCNPALYYAGSKLRAIVDHRGYLDFINSKYYKRRAKVDHRKRLISQTFFADDDDEEESAKYYETSSLFQTMSSNSKAKHINGGCEEFCQQLYNVRKWWSKYDPLVENHKNYDKFDIKDEKTLDDLLEDMLYPCMFVKFILASMNFPLMLDEVNEMSVNITKNEVEGKMQETSTIMSEAILKKTKSNKFAPYFDTFEYSDQNSKRTMAYDDEDSSKGEFSVCPSTFSFDTVEEFAKHGDMFTEFSQSLPHLGFYGKIVGVFQATSVIGEIPAMRDALYKTLRENATRSKCVFVKDRSFSPNEFGTLRRINDVDEKWKIVVAPGANVLFTKFDKNKNLGINYDPILLDPYYHRLSGVNIREHGENISMLEYFEHLSLYLSRSSNKTCRNTFKTAPLFDNFSMFCDIFNDTPILNYCNANVYDYDSRSCKIYDIKNENFWFIKYPSADINALSEYNARYSSYLFTVYRSAQAESVFTNNRDYAHNYDRCKTIIGHFNHFKKQIEYPEPVLFKVGEDGNEDAIEKSFKYNPIQFSNPLFDESLNKTKKTPAECKKGYEQFTNMLKTDSLMGLFGRLIKLIYNIKKDMFNVKYGKKDNDFKTNIGTEDVKNVFEKMVDTPITVTTRDGCSVKIKILPSRFDYSKDVDVEYLTPYMSNVYNYISKNQRANVKMIEKIITFVTMFDKSYDIFEYIMLSRFFKPNKNDVSLYRPCDRTDAYEPDFEFEHSASSEVFGNGISENELFKCYGLDYFKDLFYIGMMGYKIYELTTFNKGYGVIDRKITEIKDEKYETSNKPISTFPNYKRLNLECRLDGANLVDAESKKIMSTVHDFSTFKNKCYELFEHSKKFVTNVNNVIWSKEAASRAVDDMVLSEEEEEVENEDDIKARYKNAVTFLFKTNPGRDLSFDESVFKKSKENYAFYVATCAADVHATPDVVVNTEYDSDVGHYKYGLYTSVPSDRLQNYARSPDNKFLNEFESKQELNGMRKIIATTYKMTQTKLTQQYQFDIDELENTYALVKKQHYVPTLNASTFTRDLVSTITNDEFYDRMNDIVKYFMEMDYFFYVSNDESYIKQNSGRVAAFSFLNDGGGTYYTFADWLDKTRKDVFALYLILDVYKKYDLAAYGTISAMYVIFISKLERLVYVRDVIVSLKKAKKIPTTFDYDGISEIFGTSTINAHDFKNHAKQLVTLVDRNGNPVNYNDVAHPIRLDISRVENVRVTIHGIVKDFLNYDCTFFKFANT